MTEKTHTKKIGFSLGVVIFLATPLLVSILSFILLLVIVLCPFGLIYSLFKLFLDFFKKKTISSKKHKTKQLNSFSYASIEKTL